MIHVVTTPRAQHPLQLGDRPILRFARHEDGQVEVLSPWFQHVEFSHDQLSAADGKILVVKTDGVGITAATIHCVNGGATYLLDGPDDRGARHGTLLRSW